MKKLITITLMLGAFTLNAQTNEIKISENTEEVYYVLKNTITESSFGDNNGSFIECWIKSKSKKSIVIKKKTYKNTFQMTKVLVNCHNNQFKFIENVTYSQNGTLLKTSKFSEYADFINAIPDTTGDNIVKGACENK